MLSEVAEPQRRDAGPGAHLARHRHPRIPARSEPVHRDHRASRGPEDRLPRGNRVSQEMDRRFAPSVAGRPAAAQRLRQLPALAASRSRGSAQDMKATPTGLAGLLLLEPKVFGDTRGFFFESWNEKEFERAGIRVKFVQDNHSRSEKGVLRGLHYQVRQAQGKLVRVAAGEIWDVAVDLRRASASFGRWTAARLDAESRRMLWIPAGFAHGFVVLSDHAEVLYKSTDFYAPEHERTLLWNDPTLAISWPLAGE